MKPNPPSWSQDGPARRSSLDPAVVLPATPDSSASSQPRVAPRPLDISLHGSAVRCLEQLAGRNVDPATSVSRPDDAESSHFPDTGLPLGDLDLAGLESLVAKLNLATGIEPTRDYERLLSAHDAGHAILVVTDHTSKAAGRRHPCLTTSLLLAADRRGFHLWWPDPAGLGERIPRANRLCWWRWSALALILTPRGGSGQAEETPGPPGGLANQVVEDSGLDLVSGSSAGRMRSD